MMTRPTLCAIGLALLLAPLPGAAQTWESVAPMSAGRTDAAAAALGGRLFVIGGVAAGGTVLRSGEVYDPATNTWSAIATLSDPRAGAVALTENGTLLLVGGRDDERASDDVERYDPFGDAWTEEESMDEDRDGLAAGLIDGDLYAIGGADRDGTLRSDAELRGGSSWQSYGPWALSPGRAGVGSAVADGALVVAGGFSSFGPLDAVTRYVPDAAGTALPALPGARGGVAMVARAGELYAVGGRTASDGLLSDVLFLAPGAASWVMLTSLPEPVENAVAVVVGTHLYVAGGTRPFGSIGASVWRLPLQPIARDEAPDAAPRPAIVRLAPNPSAGPLSIRLSLPEAAAVRLDVLDMLGRVVATFDEGPLASGAHDLRWDALDVPPGRYVLRLHTPHGTSTAPLSRVR
jgi:hypothetical protein